MSLKTWERRGKHGLTRAASRLLRARGAGGPRPGVGDRGRRRHGRPQHQRGAQQQWTPARRAHPA
ncbi:MAG: hypothetical protein ACT4PE_18555, partial [Candidatus Eiseniibacteriota bacterium]